MTWCGSLITAFWGFIYAFIGNLAITMSHSEILAVFPTAGGQYHWVAMISPQRWKASLSWMTGVMNVISLWAGQATVGYLSSGSRLLSAFSQLNSATLLVCAVTVNDESWIATPGQKYAIFAAVTLLGPILTVFLGVKGNRYLDSFLMFLSIFTCLAIVITLFATASPKASAVSASIRFSRSSTDRSRLCLLGHSTFQGGTL